MPRFSAENSIVLRVGSLCLGLLISGCSLTSFPKAATRSFNNTQKGSATLVLLQQNPKVYELKLGPPGSACQPIFATALEQCRAAADSSAAGSVAKPGLARQLLIGFDDVAIGERSTLGVASGNLALFSGSARIDGQAVLLTGATLATNGCTRDYVFWARNSEPCGALWAELQPYLTAVVAEQETTP